MGTSGRMARSHWTSAPPSRLLERPGRGTTRALLSTDYARVCRLPRDRQEAHGGSVAPVEIAKSAIRVYFCRRRSESRWRVESNRRRFSKQMCGHKEGTKIRRFGEPSAQRASRAVSVRQEPWWRATGTILYHTPCPHIRSTARPSICSEGAQAQPRIVS